MDLRCHGEVPLARRDALARDVAAHHTLEEVVRDGLRCTPPRLVLRVLPQDEFTHDVVVSADDCWLVYDTT